MYSCLLPRINISNGRTGPALLQRQLGLTQNWNTAMKMIQITGSVPYRQTPIFHQTIEFPHNISSSKLLDLIELVDLIPSGGHYLRPTVRISLTHG